MPVYLITTYTRPVDNLNGSNWVVAATPEINKAIYDVFWSYDPPNSAEAAVLLTTGVIFAVVTSDRSFMQQTIRAFRGADGPDARVHLSSLDENGEIGDTRVMNVQTIRGTAGDDLLRGGNLIEDIFGQAGDDRIVGGGKSDLIRGGSGYDRIDGGDGYDAIYGDGGRDRISGGLWMDRLFGGAGGDYIDGGRDSDLIQGGTGHDRLYGDDGIDEIYGGAGKDTIRGDHGFLNSSHDEIYGGAGDDDLAAPFVGGIYGIMRGDAGNDSLASVGNLFGGDGNDRLVGNGRMFGDSGNDRLLVTHKTYDQTEVTGGDGVDRFIFTFKKDDHEVDGHMFPSHNRGKILDFDPDHERIDLRQTPFHSLTDLNVSENSSYARITWQDRDNIFSIEIRSGGVSLTEEHFLF